MIDHETIVILLDTLGTIMVAYAALRVHHRVLHEHKIDNQVFRVMKHEQRVGVVGVCIIIISACLQLVF